MGVVDPQTVQGQIDQYLLADLGALLYPQNEKKSETINEALRGDM